MLVPLPCELQEEILKWCARDDILNVALTSSKMYTDTVKSLLWESVKIDLDELKTNVHEFPMLQHTKCLSLFKKKEKKRRKFVYGLNEEEEEEEYLSGRSGRSYDTGFDYEKAVSEWNNEQEARKERADRFFYDDYLQFRQEEAWKSWIHHPYYTFEEYREILRTREKEQESQMDAASESDFDEEYFMRKRATPPNDNVFLSELNVSNLTEFHLSDIHAMVHKNDQNLHYSEHSSYVLENLLRGLKHLKNLRVVHLSSLRKNDEWETEYNHLQHLVCEVDDRVYLMTKEEFQHIEDIPNLRELKFTNIWIGKPFGIQSLEKLSVSFYTNFAIGLGHMEKLREFEGKNVTVVGDDFLDQVGNLQSLTLHRCKNVHNDYGYDNDNHYGDDYDNEYESYKGLATIAKHTHITVLDIQNNKITDEVLRKNLQYMVFLRTLKVGTAWKNWSYSSRGESHTYISRLDFLKNLRDLRNLVIIGANILASDAKFISDLEKLEELNISHCRLDGGSVFSYLCKLQKLRYLAMEHCCRANITNYEGLAGADLADFPSIRYLNMKGIELGDSDLQHISKLTSIEELNITLEEDVSGSGVNQLAQLPHIKKIRIWNRFIVLDVVDLIYRKRSELRLPHCSVKVSDEH